MSTSFTLPAKTHFDTFKDNVSIGDIVTYEIDCSPWEDDNSTITSATWTVESGQASISGQSVTDGVVSANVTFSQSGKTLISVLLVTAVQKKKFWIQVLSKDLQQGTTDDYGLQG
jgi:hypothetical protein